MSIEKFAKSLSEQIKEGRDPREKKPWILFNEEDYTKTLNYSSTWILNINQYQIHLSQPNDISLYSSIAQKALRNAKKFYKKYVDFYMKHSSGGLIPVIPEYESLYLDYYEAVIQGIIFSYTALEAFANICIPEEYKFLDEKGKTLKRERIERYKPLGFKLDTILKDILKTSDPHKEVWWVEFEKLQTVRNEILHSKPSKAEERYGQFLNADIFRVIECHRDILSFYGHFINQNQKNLLDEFPYGLGYDEFWIKYIDKEGYDWGIQNMFNPWRPPKE
jgi:hypothetical protein